MDNNDKTNNNHALTPTVVKNELSNRFSGLVGSDPNNKRSIQINSLHLHKNITKNITNNVNKHYNTTNKYSKIINNNSQLSELGMLEASLKFIGATIILCVMFVYDVISFIVLWIVYSLIELVKITIWFFKDYLLNIKTKHKEDDDRYIGRF